MTDLNYTIVRPPGLTNGMYILCLILHEVCAVQAESVHYRLMHTRTTDRQMVYSKG